MDPHFDGVIFKTHAAELARRLRHPFPPFAVLDARSPAEHGSGHVPGARLASLDGLAQGLPPGTGPGTEFFVVGEGLEDPRVRPVSLALKKLGAHRVVELTGGMVEWRRTGFEVEAGVPKAA